MRGGVGDILGLGSLSGSGVQGAAFGVGFVSGF